MLPNRDAKHLLTDKEKMIAKIHKKKSMTSTNARYLARVLSWVRCFFLINKLYALAFSTCFYS